MPTPARLAIAVRDAPADSPNASRAAARMRSRFCRASERVGGGVIGCLRSLVGVPEGPPVHSTVERRGLRFILSHEEHVMAELALVTGGSGYVGGWCVVELLRRGYDGWAAAV